MSEVTLKVSIGGIRWDFHLTGFSAETLAVVQKELVPFVDHEDAKSVCVHLIADRNLGMGDDVCSQVESAEIVFLEREQGPIEIRGRIFEGTVQGTDVYASVMDSHYSVGSAIISLLVFIGAGRGRIMLHGSSAIIEGRGYLFCGSSSAGKSTIARQLLDAGNLVLGDEFCCVQVVSDSEPMVHPVPFNGIRSQDPVSAGLHRLCFIEGHDVTEIEPKGSIDAMRSVIRNSLYATLPVNATRKLMMHVEMLVGGTSISGLRFRKGETEVLMALLIG